MHHTPLLDILNIFLFIAIFSSILEDIQEIKKEREELKNQISFLEEKNHNILAFKKSIEEKYTKEKQAYLISYKNNIINFHTKIIVGKHPNAARNSIFLFSEETFKKFIEKNKKNNEQWYNSMLLFSQILFEK